MRNRKKLSAVAAVLVMILTFTMMTPSYAGTGNVDINSFLNNYGITIDEGSYQNIVNSLVRRFQKAVEDGEIKAEDLNDRVEAYLRSIGLSDSDVTKLKIIISTAVLSQLDANASKAAQAPESADTASEKSENDKAEVEEATEIYVVKKGDTLQKIARKKYGDSGKWKEIYRLNRDIIKNPNSIDIGQELKIAAG